MAHNPLDLAYLAGIVDGEGCVEVRFLSGRVVRRTGLSLKIIVANTDQRLIDWLTTTWGGRGRTYTQLKSTRDIHTWHLPIRANHDLCKELLPYLRLKREQLELALEGASLSIIRGRNPDGTTRRVPAENLARRVSIVEEVSRLKRGA